MKFPVDFFDVFELAEIRKDEQTGGGVPTNRRRLILISLIRENVNNNFTRRSNLNRF